MLVHLKEKGKKERKQTNKNQQFVPLGCVNFTTESTYKQEFEQTR